MQNNYYNENGEYTFSLPSMPNTIAPADALRSEITPEMRTGFWPVLNVSKNSWEYKEDHRQHLDETGTLTGGTPFWLPEDKNDSPARYMATLGALPDGALLVAPALSAEEQKEKKKQDILAELAKIDSEYRTARVLGGLALGDEYAMQQWRKAEELASPLRMELNDLR